MNETDELVQQFLDGIDHTKRRRDAETLLDIMGRVTGERARMWGTVIGFGQYHYKYKSGREGDAPRGWLLTAEGSDNCLPAGRNRSPRRRA